MPRRHDAERKVGRPLRALDRHRHHRGRGVGRARQDRRTSRCTALLAERFNGGKVADKVFCYVGGGWYCAGQDHQGPAGRDAPPSRRRLHHGEDEGRRPAARRRPRPRRGGEIDPAATGAQLAVDANSNSIAPRRWPTPRRCAPFGLRWFEEPCDPLDYALLAEIAARLRAAAVDRREPVLDAGRGKPGALRRLAGRAQRRHPDRSAAGLRHRAIRRARSTCWRATAGRARACFRTAATRCRSRLPPASASAARNPIPACSATSAALPTMRDRERLHLAVRPPRHRLRGPGAAVQDHARAGG